ncbi:MAG: hypothetical protein JNM94_02330 [Phycisphaerae bacterium]|nr:hypothetical protein [Phycisphaerae bacterium]
MLPLIFAITALLAFTAAWALMSLIVGREDFAEPRCAACNRDVSDRLWPDADGAALTCACGATLDGSNDSTFRSTRRVRGRRVRSRRGKLGVVALVALLAAILTTDAVLRARGLTWWRVVPEFVVIQGVESRSKDAREEAERRAVAGTLSVDGAQDLIARAVSAGMYDLDESVARTALGAPSSREAFLARFFNVTASPTIDWQKAEPAPNGTVKLRVINIYSPFVTSFVRLEAVRIDGVQVPWRLERDETVGSFGTGHRILLDRGDLFCTPLAPLSPSGSKVEIDVTLALGPHTLGVPFDPYIDPPLGDTARPPSEWCVPVTSITRTIRCVLPPPQPLPNASVQP